MEKEEERDGGSPGLRHGKERIEVVDSVNGCLLSQYFLWVSSSQGVLGVYAPGDINDNCLLIRM